MRLVAADLFCGAGGTSAGVYDACAVLGRRCDLTAINHWPIAIETHALNHPEARNLMTAVDNVNPRDLFKPGELDLLWASPECTHHSMARGGRPINEQSRATAWCVVRWADALQPPVILVENVPEFISWGGIGTNGKPLKGKRGQTFLAWTAALESLGYRVEWRVLCAADYGDPTTRRRLFVQAVRGRRKIVWPEPTHAPLEEVDMFGGARRPWRSAREIIDWAIQGQSIFDRKRPLAPKTLRRIEAGLRKYGLKDFLVAMEHGGRLLSAGNPMPTITTAKGGAIGVATPFLVRMHGQSNAEDVEKPLSTVTASTTKHCLAEPFLVKLRGTNTAADVAAPVPTVTAGGGHLGLAEPFIIPQHSGGAPRSVGAPLPTVTTTARGVGLVEPFLVKFYGTGGAVSVDSPLDSVTTKERFGLARPEIEVDGNRFLLDVRFRMLQPHELAAAQGFRPDYKFAGTKTDAVKQIGNAVPRRLARAIVLAALTQRSDIERIIEKEN